MVRVVMYTKVDNMATMTAITGRICFMNKVFDSGYECQKSNNKLHFLFDDTA